MFKKIVHNVCGLVLTIPIILIDFLRYKKRIKAERIFVQTFPNIPMPTITFEDEI